MVAELQRTLRVRGGLARRRAERSGGPGSATKPPSWPFRAAGLLLTLAALGIVIAVSLGVAAAQRPSEDVRRLIAPADAPAEWVNRA